MKSILNSGITSLIVSHNLEQIREMCSKVLWLDHGRQIVFTDQIETVCDAYDAFLKTGKLPEAGVVPSCAE